MFLSMRRAFLACVCFAIVVTVAEASSADKAQPPVVAILDFQQITRASKAGAAVRQQVGQQHSIYQGEIKKLQTQLEDEREEIRLQQKTLAPSKFKGKSNDYRNRAETLQKLVQQRKSQLDQMYIEGMRRVEAELAAVIKDIARERGIDLILNAAQGQGIVLYADQSTVITDDVRKRLDERLPFLELAPPAEISTKGPAPTVAPARAKE